MPLQAERCNSEKEERNVMKRLKKKESELSVCNGVKRKILEEHAKKKKKKSKESSIRITYGHISVNQSLKKKLPLRKHKLIHN